MKIKIKSWLMIFLLAFMGCAYTPPKDTKGNKPEDAVRNFIKLIQSDKYQDAKKLWYGKSERISGEIPFEDFCSYFKNIDLSKCKTSPPTKGKAGFTMINIEWVENGQQKHYSFGLKIIQKEWKMSRGHDW